MRERARTRLGRVADAMTWIVGVATATAVVLLFTLDGVSVSLSLDQGRAVYEQNCASCHGADGQGGIGNRLAGVVVALYPDPADQARVVAHGRNAMPPFDGLLTDAEIDAVVSFTRKGLG